MIRRSNLALGWGIVSTGLHPENKIAPAIAKAAGSELAAVYSRDPVRAKAFAEKHGAGAAYHDLDALLSDPQVDAVFIASPNSLHAQQGIQAARAGKHVLVEKPMTTTLEDGVALVRACRDQGVTLGVGFELRHHPGHIFSRQQVAQGALGSITVAQAQWGFGVRAQEIPAPRTGLRSWWMQPEMIGGAAAIMGTGVHAVDLLRFLLGREVTEVAAITDGQRQDQPLETVAAVSLRFDQGTIATICCGRTLPDSKNDFALYGINGRITGTKTLWEAQQGRVEMVSDAANFTQAYSGEYLGNFVAQMEDFSRAVDEDREPAATGVDGLRVVEITLAALQSAREGHSVKVKPTPL
ncbi:MAG: hypothetical protein BZY88_17705 [SAR202 cluster bacterium Io17-Chloro-G9]|nr:MAG: hypothetical protein BZY88_17705 [SAR202 cluster bacterium Io17-Chloro-G9]